MNLYLKDSSVKNYLPDDNLSQSHWKYIWLLLVNCHLQAEGIKV